MWGRELDQAHLQLVLDGQPPGRGAKVLARRHGAAGAACRREGIFEQKTAISQGEVQRGCCERSRLHHHCRSAPSCVCAALSLSQGSWVKSFAIRACINLRYCTRLGVLVAGVPMTPQLSHALMILPTNVCTAADHACVVARCNYGDGIAIHDTLPAVNEAQESFYPQ
jgi:hypothetical protein